MTLKRRRMETSLHIDMTPMVDVMMLLVIFFMMSTTFILTQPGFDVNLPKATTMNELSVDNIVVLIGNDGKIAVGDKIVSLGDLRTVLTPLNSQQSPVYIKADKDVRHGVVVEVMDEIRKAGILKVSVAIDNKGIDNAR